MNFLVNYMLFRGLAAAQNPPAPQCTEITSHVESLWERRRQLILPRSRFCRVVRRHLIYPGILAIMLASFFLGDPRPGITAGLVSAFVGWSLIWWKIGKTAGILRLNMSQADLFLLSGLDDQLMHAGMQFWRMFPQTRSLADIRRQMTVCLGKIVECLYNIHELSGDFYDSKGSFMHYWEKVLAGHNRAPAFVGIPTLQPHVREWAGV